MLVYNKDCGDIGRLGLATADSGVLFGGSAQLLGWGCSSATHCQWGSGMNMACPPSSP